MDDNVHLAKFREGARAWNAWRLEYPGITPDLRDIVPNLGEKQLGPAHGGPIDLSDALLHRANLHSATLLEAGFSNADLREANLAMALLAGADLSFANLSGAILDHADLRGASLEGTLLEGARLDLARNLTQAQVDVALGDGHTLLPPHLQAPDAWRIAEQFPEWDLPDGHEGDDLDSMSPHEVLGLPRDANADAIRAAFLKLAKKYHPDVNPGDLWAERRFKTVNQAHQLLTAPEVKPSKPPSASPWPAAMALFVFAFAGPSLGLYWLGMGPFKFAPREEPRQAEQSEKPAAPPADASQPTAAPPSNTDYTGTLAEPAEAALADASEVVAPAPEAAVADAPEAKTTAPEAAVANAPEAIVPTSEATVADAPEASAPAPEAAVADASETRARAPEAAVADAPEAVPPPLVEPRTAMLHAAESQRINTASEVPFAIPPAAEERSAASISVPAPMDEPGGVAAAPDQSSPPPERLAALHPASPGPAETASAPWADEWAALQGSNELQVLHSFIQRYGEKPAADEARDRFRILVAALENTGELQKFVRETAEDSPERAVVRRRLALLVEREAAEADHKAWAETRDTGSIAAFRAYLLSYPSGKHVDKAEERLAALEEEANGRKKDGAAWAKALRTATRAGYEAYLKTHPDGRNAKDAERKIASLTAEEAVARKEEEAWAKASKEHSRAAYFAYLNAYPNGRYVDVAQASIEKAGKPQDAEPPLRAASEASNAQRRAVPRFPSSDEPFVERMPGGN